MDKLSYSSDLTEAIVGYLGTRPYSEVVLLLNKFDSELKAQGHAGISVRGPQQATLPQEPTKALPPVVEPLPVEPSSEKAYEPLPKQRRGRKSKLV